MPEVHSTPPHAGKIGNFLSQSSAGLPNWAWLLVVGGGILAAIYIPKLLPGAKTTTTDTSGTGLGLAIDPITGLPYAVEGLVPSGAGTTTQPTTSTTTTGTTPTQPSLITRRPGNSNVSEWDQTIKDIPIRDTPGGKVVGGLGYGVQVIPTGPPVTGPNNLSPGNPAGSTIWYPVQGGYISAFDIVMPGSGTTTFSPLSWPYQGVLNG